jgi:hypothetical protein
MRSSHYRYPVKLAQRYVSFLTSEHLESDALSGQIMDRIDQMA